MSVRNLVDAIIAGDSVEIETALHSELSGRIAERLDARRQELAQNMFRSPVTEQVNEEELEEVEELDEAADSSTIHVQPVGGGKYKVHKVGDTFKDRVKQGEHVSDTDLDDFQEMGGKVKHVKAAK